MQRLIGFVVMMMWATISFAATETIKLEDGTTISGEVTASSYNKDGVMVKMDDGKWSRRVPWKLLSKETVNRLYNTSKLAKPFIPEFLIEKPVEERKMEKREARKINITMPEDRLERPVVKSKMGAIFGTPVILILAFLAYASNIYAGYELAVYKNRPVALVCGLAAVLPILGNVIFYAVPPAPTKSQDDYEAESAAKAAAPAPEIALHSTSGRTEEQATEEQVVASAFPPPTIYKRGQFIFNRRFFESKFNAYFKSTLDEADRDNVVIIRTSRGEFMGQRFARLAPNDITFVTGVGGSHQDVVIQFQEVSEIIIKHKDAPLH